MKTLIRGYFRKFSRKEFKHLSIIDNPERNNAVGLTNRHTDIYDFTSKHMPVVQKDRHVIS
jgi:hypothetical protein